MTCADIGKTVFYIWSGYKMSERREIKNAERLANDVKAEAYQTRSVLEQTTAQLQAVASKIFLGDRQMANQVTAMVTQEFILLSEDITD